MALDHRGRDDLAVEHDGKGIADVVGSIIAELARPGGVETETDRRPPVLVERGLGVDQLLTRHDRRLFQHVEFALGIERGQQLFARARHGPVVAGATHDGLERQLGGGADDLFQLGGRSDAGHLDQDAVRALALDGRLTGADLVDAAADDFERLANRAVIRRQTLGLGQPDGQQIALTRHFDVGLPRTGQADHRARDLFDQAHSVVYGPGFGNPNSQLIRRAFLQTDRADRVARIAQTVADLGPEAFHPRLVDVRDLHFGQ